MSRALQGRGISPGNPDRGVSASKGTRAPRRFSWVLSWNPATTPRGSPTWPRGAPSVSITAQAERRSPRGPAPTASDRGPGLAERQPSIRSGLWLPRPRNGEENACGRRRPAARDSSLDAARPAARTALLALLVRVVLTRPSGSSAPRRPLASWGGANSLILHGRTACVYRAENVPAKFKPRLKGTSFHLIKIASLFGLAEPKRKQAATEAI